MGIVAFLLSGICVASSGSWPDEQGQDGKRTVEEGFANLPLATSSFYYHDGGSGRWTSWVRVAPQRHGERFRLQVWISPIGPLVDPAPGFAGTRGANLITAEELEVVLRSSPAVSTFESASRATTQGRMREIERGRIPIRRLLADGQLDLEAQTTREYPLILELTSGWVPAGSYHTELLIRGEPRLRLGFEVGAEGGRITGFESLSDGIDLSGGTVTTGTSLESRQDAGPAVPSAPAMVLPLDGWDLLDLEGRWLRYKQHTEVHPEASGKWVEHLIERKEYDLVEWIALAVPFAMVRDRAGELLSEAMAPQWIRLHVWHLTPHEGTSGSIKAQLKSYSGLVLDWLALHEEVVHGPVGSLKLELEGNLDWAQAPDREASRARLAAKAKALGRESLAAGDFLGPYGPDHLLGLLDVPETFVDYAGPRAEPGVVYRHQIERAIDTMVLTATHEPNWLAKLHAITQHKDRALRVHAMLAMTHLQPALIPYKDFLAVAEQAEEPLSTREAAFLAYSYGDHPSIYLRLLASAFRSEDPLRAVALSRLGDLDEGFCLARMDAAIAAAGDGEDALLESVRTRLAGRLADPSWEHSSRLRERLLERSAWARITHSPVAAELTAWTLTTVRRVTKSQRVPNEFQATYSSRVEDPLERAALEKEVIALFLEALEGLGGSER
ncbi:MAG: hypothetical protein AB7O52_19740 [Planctomycetota bacterium]